MPAVYRLILDVKIGLQKLDFKIKKKTEMTIPNMLSKKPMSKFLKL